MLKNFDRIKKLCIRTKKTKTSNLFIIISIGVFLGWPFYPLVSRAANEQNNSASLNIIETVRNLNSSDSVFSKTINTSVNDRVKFQILISNPGNVTLTNVIVRDVLPPFLNFSNGSTQIDNNFVADGLTSSGINIGLLYPGYSHTITFEASIGPILDNNYIFTNYAYARADQINERNDSATVYVSRPGAGDLNIKIRALNLTAGQVLLNSYVNGKTGDTLLFSIEVSVPGNASAVNNVLVWDNLPDGLIYISGSSRVDDLYVGEGLSSGGLNIGVINRGQTKKINFNAEVTAISNGFQSLTNTAYTSGDQAQQQSATVYISASQSIINSTPSPSLISSVLAKKVINLTSPNGSDTDNSAAIGDTLQYTITLVNNGPGALKNVSGLDILPAYTSFQSADSNGSYNSSTNQVTWLNNNLANGTSLTFSYLVTVQNVPSSGYVVRDTASASAENLGSMNSNETRTTISGKIKGGIKAVTGSDNLFKNIVVAGLISLWSIFLLYLILEYGSFWNGARLKWAILKLKLKNKIS